MNLKLRASSQWPTKVTSFENKQTRPEFPFLESLQNRSIPYLLCAPTSPVIRIRVSCSSHPGLPAHATVFSLGMAVHKPLPLKKRCLAFTVHPRATQAAGDTTVTRLRRRTAEDTCLSKAPGDPGTISEGNFTSHVTTVFSESVPTGERSNVFSEHLYIMLHFKDLNVLITQKTKRTHPKQNKQTKTTKRTGQRKHV